MAGPVAPDRLRDADRRGLMRAVAAMRVRLHEEGNTLTEDEQWAKLRRCVEVARDVWGGG